MPKPVKYLRLECWPYKRQIVVMWECSAKATARRLRKIGAKIDKQWERDKAAVIGSRTTQGFITHAGPPDSLDLLIWLRYRPRRADQFGVLLHELYHAVDRISRSVDAAFAMTAPDGDSEARAYLYEHLAAYCLGWLARKEH